MGRISSLPYEPSGSDIKSISGIMGDFQRILDEFNGSIDSTNLLAGGVDLDRLETGAQKQFVICNASGVPEYHVLSGDVTGDSSGAITIADGAVTSRKLAPSANSYGASGNLVTAGGGGWGDLPGTSQVIDLTSGVASYALIAASFDAAVVNGIAGTALNFDAHCALNVDAARQAAQLNFGNTGTYSSGAARVRTTLSGLWLVSLSVASHTIKLQASIDTAGYSMTVYQTHTKWSYVLFKS